MCIIIYMYFCFYLVPEMYWEATKKGGYRTKNSEKTSQIGLSDLLEGRHGDGKEACTCTCCYGYMMCTFCV